MKAEETGLDDVDSHPNAKSFPWPDQPPPGPAGGLAHVGAGLRKFGGRGADALIATGTSFLFNGSGSSDPDGDPLTGNGLPEICVLTAAGISRFDGSLNPLGSFALRGISSFYLEESAFPRKNLIASVPVAQTYAYYGQTAMQFLALDPVNGAEVWRSPALLGTMVNHSLAFVTLTGEANARLSFGTSKGMFLTR